MLQGGDYEANQVPVKKGTCFMYYVHCNGIVCLLPVKHGTRSGFSKYRNPSSVRNSGGIRSECATEFDEQLHLELQQYTVVSPSGGTQNSSKSFLAVDSNSKVIKTRPCAHPQHGMRAVKHLLCVWQ